MISTDLAVGASKSNQLILGKVLDYAGPDQVMVECNAPTRVLLCMQLDQGSRRLDLAPEDDVLVWYSPTVGKGIVLGRIPGDGAPAGVTREDDPPEELVLEARQSLTLRVGDGSITIREDGKILIKGRDLVSHATRRNRIKGGSVEIN